MLGDLGIEITVGVSPVKNRILKVKSPNVNYEKTILDGIYSNPTSMITMFTVHMPSLATILVWAAFTLTTTTTEIIRLKLN